MSGPLAGNFDPVKAVFYKPTPTLVNGEQQTNLTQYCTRYLRFKKQKSYEDKLQHQNVSSNTSVICVRRDSVTEQIKSNMTITHRGITYGIIGTILVNYDFDEVEITVKSKENI